MSITADPILVRAIQQSASRFYSLPSIFTEILQDAQRAGATQVEVSTAAGNDGVTVITVIGSGYGIFQVGLNLQLGFPEWLANIVEEEYPDGYGLFCLTNSDYTIESSGYQVTISPEASNEEITILPVSHCRPYRYTKITFNYTEFDNEECEAALKEACLYYPVQTYLNGERLLPGGYLDSFSYNVEYPDYTIGFYTPLLSSKVGTSNLNYFGRIVPITSPDRYITLVRVDLKTDKINLSSPNSIIQDENYYQLIADIRYEYYTFLSNQPKLPPEINDRDEEVALDLGIDLAPLRQFHLVYKTTPDDLDPIVVDTKALNKLNVFSYVLCNPLTVNLLNRISTKKYHLIMDPTTHLKRKGKNLKVEARINNEWVDVDEVNEVWVEEFRVIYSVSQYGQEVYKEEPLDTEFFVVFANPYRTPNFEGKILYKKGGTLNASEIVDIIADVAFEGSEAGVYETEREDYCGLLTSHVDRN